MTLNLASMNMKGLRDSSKFVCLLGELSNLCVEVVIVQETHFFHAADPWVLEDDFVIFSAHGSRCSAVV